MSRARTPGLLLITTSTDAFLMKLLFVALRIASRFEPLPETRTPILQVSFSSPSWS
jgi:hypothetical protein